jgi:peptidoglycan hydrolase CwlO-like protein
LRYTEFIALNTWQIQRLKPRMTAAEQEIAALKQEIAELKSQLQKFQ